MELDQLKQAWMDTDIKKNKNTNIMELMKHRSYGPLAALKREFRTQSAVMIIIPIVLLLTNVDNITAALTSVMFWSYTAFCLAMVFFGYFNYRMVSKMERMDGMVRLNLEQQINVLETRLKWKMVGLRITLLFFIALTEVLPYFQSYRMLDMWHSLDPFIRFGTYAALLTLQYFMSSMVNKRKFGVHVDYLKELMKEMT
jgi:hypothetical protein